MQTQSLHMSCCLATERGDWSERCKKKSEVSDGVIRSKIFPKWQLPREGGRQEGGREGERERRR